MQLSEIRHWIYYKVNMQSHEIVQIAEFDAPMHAATETAMSQFGELEPDEDVFTMVRTDWTHAWKRKH